MDSSKDPLLSELAVFRNILNDELIRSVHVYRFDDGNERRVEREFMFSPDSYMEIAAQPLLELSGARVSELCRGRLVGLWLCILAFEADRPSILVSIPSILIISRNPKLKLIPTLADDLQKVFQLRYRTENKETSQSASEEMSERNKDNHLHSRRMLPVFDQDLNCLPYPIDTPSLSENQQDDQGVGEDEGTKKKKRAATEHVARLALADLAKYFDVPIAEASRKLSVGLTVLKRKCREFGIPRWPHRKIKSLDTLIHDLQEEAERQEQENKAAALAVTKRQKMLESEKESIEKKPFMEIKSETKRFRQDVFKRRHKARALNNKS